MEIGKGGMGYSARSALFCRGPSVMCLAKLCTCSLMLLVSDFSSYFNVFIIFGYDIIILQENNDKNYISFFSFVIFVI